MRLEAFLPASVDCLMVSAPTKGRWPLFQQAVRDFCNQEYSHRRLLVLLNNVSLRDRHNAIAFLSSFRRQDIVWDTVKGKPNLGKLRNLSIQLSDAPFLCQWDDDDRYHPLRLTEQMRFLRRRKADAALLRDVNLLFKNRDQLHRIRWRFGVSGQASSILFRRGLDCWYPETGAHCRRGEDIQFLARMMKQGLTIGLMEGRPELYTYVVHRHNQWPSRHYQTILKYNAFPQKSHPADDNTDDLPPYGKIEKTNRSRAVIF